MKAARMCKRSVFSRVVVGAILLDLLSGDLLSGGLMPEERLPEGRLPEGRLPECQTPVLEGRRGLIPTGGPVSDGDGSARWGCFSDLNRPTCQHILEGDTLHDDDF